MGPETTGNRELHGWPLWPKQDGLIGRLVRRDSVRRKTGTSEDYYVGELVRRNWYVGTGSSRTRSSGTGTSDDMLVGDWYVGRLVRRKTATSEDWYAGHKHFDKTTPWAHGVHQKNKVQFSYFRQLGKNRKNPLAGMQIIRPLAGMQRNRFFLLMGALLFNLWISCEHY